MKQRCTFYLEFSIINIYLFVLEQQLLRQIHLLYEIKQQLVQHQLQLIYCNFLQLFNIIKIISHFIFSADSSNKSVKIPSSENTPAEATPHPSLESSNPSVDNKSAIKPDANLSDDQQRLIGPGGQKRPRTEANSQQPNTTFDSNTSLSNQQNNEKKTTQGGRCRLFIGNVPCDLTQDEFQLLFGKYGELVEYFVNPSRGFGFIKLVRLIF